MALHEGRLLAGLVQPKQVVTITLPTPREELLATPEELPTAEPAASQIVYTVQQSDLPVLPPGASCMYTALLYVAGKNAGAASAYVYCRLIRNGVSQITGSACFPSSGQYYTVNAYMFNGVAVGDTIECRLWAGAAGVNWDYRALVVSPTRLKAWKNSQLLVSIKIDSVPFPSLTLGNPYRYSLRGFYAYHDDVLILQDITSLSAGVRLSGPQYSLACVYLGDYFCSVSGTTSASYRPYFVSHYVPTVFTFRPTPLIIP